MTPEIAIVDSNTLSCLGLQNLLEEIIPTAIIRSFRSFGELMDDTPDMYVHYFISSQIYFEHTAFFLERKPKTIVLVNGETVSTVGHADAKHLSDEQNLAKTSCSCANTETNTDKTTESRHPPDTRIWQ